MTEERMALIGRVGKQAEGDLVREMTLARVTDTAIRLPAVGA